MCERFQRSFCGLFLFLMTGLCLLGGISVRDLSVTAPIIQFIGSVNDFEADLRKAGINARLVCASQ
jgi:hypothetical protein